MRRLLLFAVVVAGAAAAAAGLGRAVGPLEREAPPAAHGAAEMRESTLRLAAVRTTFAAGRRAELAFRILDGDTTVRDYDVVHTRRMHLIVASRDLAEFHHVHPALGADGVWRTQLRFARAGAFRVFADFTIDGEKTVATRDLVVTGIARTSTLPAARSEVRVDGYRVALHRAADGVLRFDVSRKGRAVRPDTYLGARGHLVVLREGDLEYLHTHADEDELVFETEFPTAARYRAFLQFRAGGLVHTAPFTLEVS